MRVHAELGSPDKEPWSFGKQEELINKRAIELRYQLLPHIYNVMQQSVETGVPAMRPLFMEFPEEEGAAAIDDEFLFGSDLLVAPVLREGMTERSVYLPKGDWYDFWTGRRFAGGVTNVPVTLSTLPLFVRGGAFVFRQPVVQHTGQMPGKPLQVLVVPGQSETSFYEDDGSSLDYRQGVFLKRRFRQSRGEREVVIDVSRPEGSYRPAARDLIFELWNDREPREVLVQSGDDAKNSVSLPRLSAGALTGASRGWTWQDGSVTVKLDDRFEAERVTARF